MNLRPVSPSPLGAAWNGRGVNFFLYSENATRVDLCLFGSVEGGESRRIPPPECLEQVRRGIVADIRSGQPYGFRVQGTSHHSEGPRSGDPARRANPSKHRGGGLIFHEIGDKNLFTYSFTGVHGSTLLDTVLNWDPVNALFRSATLPMAEGRLIDPKLYEAHDLSSESRNFRYGSHNKFLLDPWTYPAHNIRFRGKIRNEKDFDFFL